MDKNSKLPSRIEAELAKLPVGFDDLSDNYRILVAALRLHGFSVLRADESRAITRDEQLDQALGTPSIWIQAKGATNSNNATKANLVEQQKLLHLLEKFYKNHRIVLSTQLIVETLVEYGAATLLRPQGANIRLIMNEDDQREQQELYDEEIDAFSKFLVDLL